MSGSITKAQVLMTGEGNSGSMLTPWAHSVSTLALCGRCRVAYTGSAYCSPCLREVDADLAEKRAILFPRQDLFAL